MPPTQRGQAYRLGPNRWGLRYYDGGGRRRRRSPFPSRSAALAHFRDARDAMGIADPVETFTFAKWAADQAMSANDVSQRLSKLWVDKLGLRERAEFLELAGRVIAADGSPSAEQIAAVAKLKERLKLA